jgi:hypothetical protein
VTGHLDISGFITRERIPDILSIGGWVNLRVTPGTMAKRKFMLLY